MNAHLAPVASANVAATCRPEVRRPPILLMARHLDLGGSERQLTELALALGRDYRIHVGSFRSGGVRWADLKARRVPGLDLPMHSFRSPAAWWRSIRLLRDYIHAQGIALVHSFDPPTNVFLGFSAPFLSSAVLVSHRSAAALRTPMFRFLGHTARRAADGIVVNCECLRVEVIKGGVRPERVHLCYNGVDTARFERRGTEQTACLPSDALVVGTVCALRPEKGVSTLLRAFAAAWASDSRLFLIVVGDGLERRALEREAHQLGIIRRCAFEGARSDVLPWLNLFDIFVVPSLSEACSNALLEAMASQRACIASRVGGNPELVSHGETGLLFEPEDVPGLTRCIRMLAGDESLRCLYGQRAAGRVAADFTIERAAARLSTIYRQYLDAASLRHAR